MSADSDPGGTVGGALGPEDALPSGDTGHVVPAWLGPGPS